MSPPPSREYNERGGDGLTRTSTPSPLSGEGLDRLLALLDPDRDQAGLKYEALRRNLLRFFAWRDCRPAEELADETLDRVSRKLLEGVELRLGNPAAYVYGVARNVAREARKRSARRPQQIPLGDEVEDAPDPASIDPAAEELESALRCLDRCLEALPIEMRRLVLLYHGRQGRGAPTERLLEALGIPPSALWLRMHRLRKRLERCVRDCQEGNRASRHSSMGGARAMSGPATAPERRARYLLGLASEEEREAVEAELLADEESFERLQAAEDKLFDVYAAGGLPPAQEAAFRRRYLSSDEGRQRLTFARALRQRADEAEAQLEGRGSRSGARWAAVAAALAAALTAGWLGVQNLRLRSEVERLRAERRADPTPAPPQPVDPKSVAPSAPRIAIVRLPAQPGTAPTEVTLEPGTRSVRLEVALDEDEDSATFDAVVRSVEGKEVWRQEGLAPKQFGAPLVVMAPADAFPDGDYVLSVEGEPSREAPRGSARRYRLRLKR